jgi:hypothetical protein
MLASAPAAAPGKGPARWASRASYYEASADPGGLVRAKDAIGRIRAGSIKGTDEPGGRVTFPFGGFSILTSKALLEGRTGDPRRGGSGLASQ